MLPPLVVICYLIRRELCFQWTGRKGNPEVKHSYLIVVHGAFQVLQPLVSRHSWCAIVISLLSASPNKLKVIDVLNWSAGNWG